MFRRISRCLLLLMLLVGHAVLAQEDVALSTGGLSAAGQEDYQDTDMSVPENEVYKTRDAQGNIVFTDKPPKNTPAEKIVVPTVNTMSPAQRPEPRYSDAEQQPVEQEVIPYMLQITSPLADDVYGQEVDSVNITVELEPGLQDGHTLELLLNGEVVATDNTSVTVAVEERGTYTVGARILDAEGVELKAAAPVSFHLRRITVEQFKRNQANSNAMGVGSGSGAAGAGGVKGGSGVNPSGGAKSGSGI